MTTTIEITDKIYDLTAARLREALGTADWFNGSVELLLPASEAPATPGEEILCRLTLSAIIYRRTEVCPEGTFRPITDVVPVWWEFSTTIDPAAGPSDGNGDSVSPDHALDRRQKGLCPNDFTFSRLKPLLIDYD
jgi:hypothetical protein